MIYGYKIIEDNSVKELRLPKKIIEFIEISLGQIDTFKKGKWNLK